MTDKPVNSFLWNLMIKRNKVIPLILRGRLQKKVWSDHELMAGLAK
jgi:hypothetical protein